MVCPVFPSLKITPFCSVKVTSVCIVKSTLKTLACVLNAKCQKGRNPEEDSNSVAITNILLMVKNRIAVKSLYYSHFLNNFVPLKLHLLWKIGHHQCMALDELEDNIIYQSSSIPSAHLKIL